MAFDALISGLTSSGDVTRFSTTSTTPSFDLTPMAVVPSCEGQHTHTWQRKAVEEFCIRALLAIALHAVMSTLMVVH